jgi:hypothetical protein
MVVNPRMYVRKITPESNLLFIFEFSVAEGSSKWQMAYGEWQIEIGNRE